MPLKQSPFWNKHSLEGNIKKVQQNWMFLLAYHRSSVMLSTSDVLQETRAIYFYWQCGLKLHWRWRAVQDYISYPLAACKWGEEGFSRKRWKKRGGLRREKGPSLLWSQPKCKAALMAFLLLHVFSPENCSRHPVSCPCKSKFVWQCVM